MRRKIALRIVASAILMFGINHMVNLLNFKSPTTSIAPNDDPSLATFSKYMHFKTIGHHLEDPKSNKTKSYKGFEYRHGGIHPTIMHPNIFSAIQEKLRLNTTNEKAITQQTLIVSYWKSGATLLGELLNMLSQTFYHYEPLYQLSEFQMINSTEIELQAIRLIRKLFNCEFRTIDGFAKWINNSGISERMKHNTRVWRVCKDHLHFCSDTAVLTQICKTYPRHIMKTVRLRVRACRRILQDNERLQIIHLVRDPRGMYNSLKDEDWCFDNCTDPEFFCKEMLLELTEAAKLQEEFPERFVTLRYEDLASNPEATMKNVLQFLGTRFEIPVIKYIQTHNKIERGTQGINDFNTTAFKWLKELDKSEIIDVQQKCHDVIDALEYPFFPDENNTETPN